MDIKDLRFRHKNARSCFGSEVYTIHDYVELEVGHHKLQRLKCVSLFRNRCKRYNCVYTYLFKVCCITFGSSQFLLQNIAGNVEFMFVTHFQTKVLAFYNSRARRFMFSLNKIQFHLSYFPSQGWIRKIYINIRIFSSARIFKMTFITFIRQDTVVDCM